MSDIPNAKSMARSKKKMTNKNSRAHSTQKGGGKKPSGALPKGVAKSDVPIEEGDASDLTGGDFARRPKLDNNFRYEHDSEEGEEEESLDSESEVAMVEKARLTAIRLDEQDATRKARRAEQKQLAKEKEEQEDRIAALALDTPSLSAVTGLETVDQLLDMFDEMV